MNRKRIKEEYDINECLVQLKKLIIEEDIIVHQKSSLYAEYKTYEDLYNLCLKKNEELEEENSRLYETCINNEKEKENTIDDTNNIKFNDNIHNLDKENIAMKYKQASNDSLNYIGFNSLHLKMTSLKKSIIEKDKRMANLENDLIRHQIILRSLNKPDVKSDLNEDELIKLKAEVEYLKVDKERNKIINQHKVLELTVLNNEFMNKYKKLMDEYEKSLCTIERQKDVMNKKKINFINKLDKVEDTISKLKEEFRRVENIIKYIQINYKYIIEYNYILIEKLQKNMIDIKFNKKENNKTGEEWYDEEINNLVSLCENLTEENNKKNKEILKFKEYNLILENEKSILKKELEISKEDKVIILSGYINEIQNKKRAIEKYQKMFTDLLNEKQKLVRLNVDRIKLCEVYKDDIKHKTVEILSLETKNKDVEDMINKYIENNIKKDTKKEVFILCTLCDNNRKDVAISSCMHTFCKGCLDIRIKMRDRKCPTCGLQYHISDIKKFYL